MIEGVFEFTDKNARDVITPRTEIVALPADLSLKEAARRVAAVGRSRYPVHGETLDDIVGTVHAKDIFTASNWTKLSTQRSAGYCSARSVITRLRATGSL
jgi:CBS domain containing-hemolysin-like protein